ncbi:MAG: hypothetical protein U1E14_15590 [Geminicoccaceae bacterium]
MATSKSPEAADQRHPDRSEDATPNWDQVRRRIDTGVTGDKIAYSDPAIAPLGTDAEDGGHPQQPMRTEELPTRRAEQPLPGSPTPRNDPLPSRSGFLWAGVAVVVVMLLVLVAL